MVTEEQYRLLSESTIDWVYWRQGENIIYSSPSSKKITGYTAEEFIQNPELIENIIFNDDKHKMIFHKNNYNEDESDEQNIEFRIVKKDGEVRWLNHICNPVFSQSGEYIGRVSSNRDITEIKTANELIKYLAKFPSENTAPVMRISTNGSLLYANSASYKLFPTWQLQEGIMVPEFLYIEVAETMSMRERKTIEVQYKNKYYSFSIVPIIEEGYANIYSCDITESKQNEAKLRMSEEYYRSVVDNIGIGVSLISPSMEILSLNKQMTEWFPKINLSTCPICYQSFNEPPLSQPCSYCPTTLTLKDGLRHESVTETKAGQKIINFRIVSSAVKDNDGKVIGAIELVEDVTNRRAAERKIHHYARLYATLSQVNQTIVRVKQKQELFDSICKVAVDFGEFKLAWIGLYELATGAVSTIASLGKDGITLPFNNINANELPFSKDLVGKTLNSGKVNSCNDIMSRNSMTHWQEYAIKDGYRSAAGIPIRQNEEIIGILNLYASEENFFSDEEEIKLLEEMGLDISFALDMMQAEDERKRTEKALKESENRFETAFRFSPAAIAITYVKDGIIVDVNEAWTNLFGYERGYAIGKTSLELGITSSDIREMIIDELKQKGLVRNLETSIINRWGENRNIFVSMGINQIGGELCNLTTMIDITDRKKAENALKESEQLYRLISENAGDVIWILDIKTGKLNYISPSIIKLSGYAPEELIGATIADVVTPESYVTIQSLLPDRLAAAESGDKSVLVQTHQIDQFHKDRSIIHTEIVTTLIKDDKNKVIEIIGVTRNINERISAQQELRQGEERLRLALTATKTGVWEYDIHNDKVFWSPECYDIFGVSDIELNFTTFYSFVHPDDLDYYYIEINKILNDKNEDFRLEFRIIKPDNSIIWLLDQGKAVFDYSGNLLRIIGTVHDITERKQAEIALNNSALMWDNTFNSIGDAVMVMDEDGNILRGNNAMSKFLGIDTNDYINKYCYEVVHSSNGCIENCPLELSKTTNKREVIEVESKDKWLEITIDPINNYTDTGNTFVHIIKDITGRKHSEEKLKKSEELYSNLFDNTGTATIIVRKDTTIYMANNECFNITGFTPDELVGKSWMNFVDPGSLGIMIENFKARYSNTGNAPKRYETRLINKSGESRDSILSIGTIPDKDMIIVSMIDITDRVRAENELELNQSRLENSMKIGNLAWWEMDCDTGNVMFNYRKAEMLGYSHERFKHYTDFTDLLHPDDYDPAMNAMQNHLDGKVNTYEIDYRIRTIDGDYKWLHDIGGITQYDSDGKPLKVTGMVLDITQRKLQERIILESEEKFRKLFELSPFGIIIHNGQTVQYANKSAVNILRAGNLENLIGYGLMKLVHLDFHALTAQRINTMKISNIGVPLIEERLIRLDGTEFDAEVISEPIEIDGEICSQVIFSDITERKFADEILRQSEEKFSLAFHSSPYAITITRYSDGLILEVNESFFDITGYDSKDIYGKTTVDLGIWVDERDRDLILTELLKGRAVSSKEFLFRKKSGELILGLFSADIISINKEKCVLSSINDITERKKAEQALIESEEKLKVITQSAMDGIILMNNEGNISYWNPAAEKIFGYKHQEVLGRNLREIISPKQYSKNYSESLLEWDKTELSEGNGKTIELTAFRKDSTEFNLELSLSSVKALGSLMVVGIIRDVTERKRTEENLRLSEERFRSVVDNIGIGVSMISPNMEILTMNNQMREWFPKIDHKLCPVCYKSFNDPPLEEPCWYCPTILTLKDGLIHESITETRNDSQVFNYRVVTSPVMDKYGNVLAVIEMVEDITERKRAEMALMQSEEKFRQYIENAPDGIFITDEHGNYVDANRAALELTGYTFEELCYMNIIELIPEDERRLAIEIFSKLKGTGRVSTEIKYLKKNGDLGYWIIEAVKLDEKRYLGFTKEISDRKRIEFELITAKEKAEEMNRVKTNFLANMSHELRTPLNSILGFSEIISSEYRDNEDIFEMSNSINISGKRLKDTLNMILDLSRVEADKLELNYYNIDLNRLLAELIELQKPVANNKNIDLIYIDFDEKIEIYADEFLLSSIFNNLINNSIKFTNSGSITLILTKQNNENIVWAKIQVIDSGIGIQCEKINLIFEEFRQGSEGLNRNFEGTGLGLTITKKYVEILNGNISVESKIGEGTVFTVFLPLEKNPSFNNSDTSIFSDTIAKMEIIESVESNPKYRILLLDDDSFNCDVAVRFLRNLYSVDVVSSGEAAIKLCSNNTYDAMLIDINLGAGMDGIEALKEIRKLDKYKDVPAIASTAYAMKNDRESFLIEGFDYYISKPYTKQEITDLLKSILIQ